MRADRLAHNDSVLLERLPHDVWQQQFTVPDAPENDTGMVLIDAELCTQVRSSLRVFEEFSDLVDDYTWNPARELKPLRVLH